MVMKYAGLDISDDAIRCLEYSIGADHSIQKYAMTEIPEGIMTGGDIKNEKQLLTILSEFDKKNNLEYVKVSIPEEKAYLFQTDVPSTDIHAIEQNIEFKLEENVPLSGKDAVFSFDILPVSVTAGALRVSVSVVPRTYIEHYIALLRSADIFPVAFEVVPKAIARAIIPPHVRHAVMVVHIMSLKTGIYLILGGVVCFTSTIAWGSHSPSDEHSDISLLTKEISRIHEYWATHSSTDFPLGSLMLVGRDAPSYENALRTVVADIHLSMTVASVWQNSFSLDEYVPPIAQGDSLDYAVAAGLAMDA